MLWRLERRLRLQEIESAFNRLKICPKCNSKEGFWLGLKYDKPYVHCKGCGAIYELYEVYTISEETRTPRKLTIFRK